MKRVRKRLMLTVCAMVLPLAVTLIIYNIYSMTALNRQAAQSAAGTGYIYEQFYEKDIKTVESYMISEMVGNDFRRLNWNSIRRVMIWSGSSMPQVLAMSRPNSPEYAGPYMRR